MRRLSPSPAAGADDVASDVDVDAAYRDVPGGRPRPAGRPWVTLLMISSADGATVVDGRSGALGADGDRAVFRAVRATADAVLVGASTTRAERYRPLAAPRRLLVVTGSGDIGPAELSASPTTTLVMPGDAAAPGLPAGGATVLRAGGRTVDLAAALGQLAGVDHVVCEGGPSLNGQLLAAGLVDEVCLSVAPVFAAGPSPRLAHGDASAGSAPWTLAHVLADEQGYLFLRYVRPG